MRGRNGVLISQLYRDWLTAEQKSYEIFDQLKEDYNDPRYITAAEKADNLLQEIIQSPTLTASGILTKLRIACMFEDFQEDAEQPECKYVAPKAIVSAMRDLEKLSDMRVSLDRMTEVQAS